MTDGGSAKPAGSNHDSRITTHPSAGEYPTRPIRYIVPFGSGPTEAQARWIAQRLGAALGQLVNVENLPGESGMAGTRAVARAAPDGYTLLAANPGPLTVGPAVKGGAGYDAARDFAPVALMVTVPGVIAVHPGVAARDLKELLDLARSKPGVLRYGSAGAGTVSHLAVEWLNRLAGTRMAHLPRKGLEQAVPELGAGEFDLLVIPLPDARPLALAGRIRALAVTRRARSTLWPELPSAEEAGATGFDSFNWNGVAAPVGTPSRVIEKINNKINNILNDREARDWLGERGYEIAGGTPAEFGEFIRAESAKWRKAAELAGLAGGTTGKGQGTSV